MHCILFIVGLLMAVKCSKILLSSIPQNNKKVFFIIIKTVVRAIPIAAIEMAVNSHQQEHELMVFGYTGTIFGILLPIIIIIKPGEIDKKTLFVRGFLSAASFIAFFLILPSGITIGKLLIQIIIFAIYSIYIIKNTPSEEDNGIVEEPTYLSALFGIAGIVLGSQLIADNFSHFALLCSVSEKCILITTSVVFALLSQNIRKTSASKLLSETLELCIIYYSLIIPLLNLIQSEFHPLSYNSSHALYFMMLMNTFIPALFCKKMRKSHSLFLFGMYTIFMQSLF